MKFGPSANDKRFGVAAFTLVEVLAAMLVLAIVVPVAIEALHVASTAGTVAVRKAEAMCVADQVLNESIIMGNWNKAGRTGDVVANGHTYHWTMSNGRWTDEAMRVLTVEVTFSAQDRPCLVRLGTLVNAP